MHSSALFLLPALLAATVSAQEISADVLVYNAADCGENPNNPNLVSIDLKVFKGTETKIVNGKRVSSCMYSLIDVNSWKMKEGKYSVHIDENSIPDGCEMIFFDGAPDDDELNQGDCWSFTRRVPSDGKCTSLSLGPRFGSTMCCGAEACKVGAGDFPDQPPSKRESIRDVTEIKRTSPLQHKRAECVWHSPDKKSVITYGEQKRVSAEINCGEVDCHDAVELSYSLTTTNSFGVSTSVSASLFEVISVSVSFEYTYSESRETTISTTYTGDRPKNSVGYITFQPKYECSPKGKFKGDCDNGIPTNVEGDACFPLFLGNLPDGRYTFVQTN